MAYSLLMGIEQKKKQERIHRRQLFNGRYTAEEYYRKNAFPPDAICVCGSKAIAIRVRSFHPLANLLKNMPGLAMQIAAKHEGRIPVVEMRGPGGVPVKYVRIGDAFACDLCKKDLQKAASKHPSDVIMHFDTGPEPDRPIVQVPKIILTDE